MTPALQCHSLTLFEIALNNEIDYTTVLSYLREARREGLIVPVLLMGTVHISPLHGNF